MTGPLQTCQDSYLTAGSYQAFTATIAASGLKSHCGFTLTGCPILHCSPPPKTRTLGVGLWEIYNYNIRHFLLDPDTCEDGLSFEMTFRLDKDALKYTDMKYIVDSGASTFNSKGFSLYTVHGNLRADLAIANQEFCLQIPLTVRKWQDILVTWKKSEGKLY